MNKEEFIELMIAAQKYLSELDRWSDYGIDLFNLPISKFSWDIFNITIKYSFNETGEKWIKWWLSKKVYRNEYLMDTLESFWELVKIYRK